MDRILRPSFALLLPVLLLALSPTASSAQEPVPTPPTRGAKAPLIRKQAPPPPGPEPAKTPSAARQPVLSPTPGAGANPFAAVGPPAKADPKTTPRPADPRARPPFDHDRPLLEVDGQAITAAELNELVAYYRTFRPGSVDILLRDAVAALVPLKAVQAHFSSALLSMRGRIEAARKELEGGVPWERVVKKYSQDDEAPTPDGRYRFGHEVAVQPFDRLAHSGKVGELKGPFLTQYGYHLLQIESYQRGDQPSEDRSEVRHVLIMYPFQTEDPRSEIQAIVAACKIRILEPGLDHVLPPDLRSHRVE